MPMESKLYRILQEQSVYVLELLIEPEIDALLMDNILDAVTAAMQNGGASGIFWVLDLTQVRYLNSAGLGLLVNIRHRVRQAKGKLALCGLSPTMVQLFRSCFLEQLFTITRTRSEAIRAIV